jgi:t-SNARE complex subunit (syntaxin)
MVDDFQETEKEKKARQAKVKRLGVILVVVLVIWYFMWQSVFGGG